MNPLAIALALSLLGNVAAGLLYVGERDRATRVTSERDQARSQASACSDATADLREQADKAFKENKDLRAAATAFNKTQQAKAGQILKTPPSVPGNDCASAGDRFDNWLRGEAP